MYGLLRHDVRDSILTYHSEPLEYHTIALGRNKASHQRVGFSWSSTSLNATVSRWRPSTLATRYATTRCICSSTLASLASNGSCGSSTAPTTPTSSLPSNRQEAAEVATVSVRTSQARSSPNPRKTSSNTAPPAPTLSTPSISVARNSLSEIS